MLTSLACIPQEFMTREFKDILALTNKPKGTMPFRYLGIPPAVEKLKVSSYDSFINIITSCIGARSCASLSYGGREELVRAVLQGMECFLLSIFFLSGYGRL